ncbi:MAG: HNH endonuclease [Bacilli bacterium]|nr:HNH endonuclease [Bacilli bacterium]
MKRKTLLEFVKTNQEVLFSIFNSTFNIDKLEFNEVMFQIMSINFDYDEFYGSLYQNESFYECFKIENLTSLRNFLMQIGLDEQNLKRVINDVPEIILLSNKIDSIYPLFKCDDFKGIAFLHESSFKAFMLPKVIDFFKAKKFRNYDFSIEYERLISLSYYNEYENKETVSQLMETLNRNDSMIYYGLTINSTLKDKFDALANVFDQFNYYFLKPKNLLVERQAKQTAVDDNQMYCCDLCGKKSADSSFLGTKHVIPLHMGGKDDIYNLACLCDECQDRVVRNSVNMAKTHQILCALKRRIYDNYPQYQNAMLACYNMSDVSFDGSI